MFFWSLAEWSVTVKAKYYDKRTGRIERLFWFILGEKEKYDT